jgi:hypothetical protein
VATYRVYLAGTPLIAATYSGIRIDVGDSQSMPRDSGTGVAHASSLVSCEHYAYITIPAPVMEYPAPAALDVFHRGNGLVHHFI